MNQLICCSCCFSLLEFLRGTKVGLQERKAHNADRFGSVKVQMRLLSAWYPVSVHNSNTRYAGGSRKYRVETVTNSYVTTNCTKSFDMQTSNHCNICCTEAVAGRSCMNMNCGDLSRTCGSRLVKLCTLLRLLGHCWRACHSLPALKMSMNGRWSQQLTDVHSLLHRTTKSHPCSYKIAFVGPENSKLQLCHEEKCMESMCV